MQGYKIKQDDRIGRDREELTIVFNPGISGERELSPAEVRAEIEALEAKEEPVPIAMRLALANLPANDLSN